MQANEWLYCTDLGGRRKQFVRLHLKGIKIMQIVDMSGLTYRIVRKAIDLYEAGSWPALKPAAEGAEANDYKYLAGLGHFAPTALQNVQRVDVGTAATLIKQGALLVDVRSEKELKAKPTIFSCNGAECWKSYKASQLATAKGFQKVYWLRGGLPEWEAAGLPLSKD